MDCKTRIPCILCGKDETTDFHVMEDIFGMSLDISLCKNDGLLYINPRWSQSRYDYFYEKEYINATNELTPDSSRDRGVWDLLKFLGLDHEPAFSAALDIGAGCGHMLKRLKEEVPNCSSYAIEPDKNNIKSLETLGVKVLDRKIEDLKSSVLFSHVFMLHSLEHFLDPLAVLTKVHNLMDSGGTLAVQVPNALNPLGRARDYIITPHTYYFNISTLDFLLKKAGFFVFMIEEQGYFVNAVCFKSSCEKPEPKLVENLYKEQLKVITKPGFL